MSSFHVLAQLIQVREERTERHLMGQFPIYCSYWGLFQLCQLAGMKENAMYFLFLHVSLTPTGSPALEVM